MRYLFEKIKYSEFYKKYFKELKFTMFLRKIRDVLKMIKKKVNGWLEPKKRIDNIFAVLEKYLLSEEETNAFVRTMAEKVDSLDEPVDVIIPIYNGYDYLTKLFVDLEKTNMPCHYILVDDKSPDEKVHELEEEFVAKHENATLIQHEVNGGFVKSVNDGLAISKGHVALINTDTELPEGWLERLMAPIIKDEKVGSTTPFTNSGTIFSFPHFGVNNDIYLGMSIDEVDSYFARLKPQAISAPTGVGFCMGMNRKAIDAIGDLDYETFDRGFGEENDWCQRAIKAGFLNVYVENLFVYHKHGGSFLSEEKEQLIADHLQKLNKKHPTYDYQVKKFVNKDPQRVRRNVLQMLIDTHEKHSVLYFAHDMGGGAESYRVMMKNRFLGDGACVSTIRYQTMGGKYQFLFESEDCVQEYEFNNFEEILRIGEWLHFDEIIINELVTYPKLWDAHKKIIELKEQQQATLVMLMHDYFALCSTINFLLQDGTYCGEDTGCCETCFKKFSYPEIYECDSRSQWLLNWQEFLLACDEVRCFSKDTYQRVEGSFSEKLALTLVPHQVPYAFPVYKEAKTTETLNIGLLGVLAKHKGGEKVRELLTYIEENQLDVNVRLIGWTDGINLSNFSHFSATGRYTPADLPRLVYENDIDVFFIASIWPETFSYTAQEIMQMGLPLMSYDLGAPAERIKEYEKGQVVPKDATPDQVIATMRELVPQEATVIKEKEVIYVAEYISFSSRYRLEHLQEELLFQGISGRLFDAKRLPKQLDWDNVGALVIYRSRYQGKVKRVVDEAKAHGVPVLYDIDDLIFDESQMDYEVDFDRQVYGEFSEYSKAIADCMEASDGILVSTENMRKAVNKRFPEKPVYVNRNVASTQMLIYSAQALANKTTNRKKIRLGYFSGSNTHNDDFALISDVILEFMQQHKNVILKIVGCMELPPGYSGLAERIERVEFLEWQDLPAEIASVDINLMPLVDTFFHRCKSENKWMEAALVQVPTVATYNDEIALATKDGENILLCKNETDWMKNLTELVEHPDRREEVAKVAHDEVVATKTTLAKDEALRKFVMENTHE